MLLRLRPTLGHARLSNAWRFGSSCLLPRVLASMKPAEAASRLAISPCRLVRLRPVSTAAAPATGTSLLAEVRHPADAGAAGEASTSGRSNAYPFPEIEEKWQRCVCAERRRLSTGMAWLRHGIMPQPAFCPLQTIVLQAGSLGFLHLPVSCHAEQCAASDRYWAENKTFRTPEFKDLDTSKPKFYALDMFPYPRCCSIGAEDLLGG